jgi:hypothetical protein
MVLIYSSMENQPVIRLNYKGAAFTYSGPNSYLPHAHLANNLPL